MDVLYFPVPLPAELQDAIDHGSFCFLVHLLLVSRSESI